MAFLSGWCRRSRGRAIREAEERRRAEQDAARRHIADLAAAEARRQREQRDRRFPQEHRPCEVDSRHRLFARNHPSRWCASQPLTLRQRHAHYAAPALAGQLINRSLR